MQLPQQLHTVVWQPDGVYPPTTLDELALNCSTLKDGAACDAAAAASNAYEGEQLPLSTEDLAAHTTVCTCCCWHACGLYVC
jgi:hypothetical protein